MNPVRRDAPCGQSCRQVAEKARRPANVEIAIARDAQLIKNLHLEVTRCVIVAPLPIIRRWSAIPDLTSPVRKHSEKSSHLYAERMRLAVPCTMQPPDRARCGAFRESMQHGERGCRANSSTKQHDRPVARAQDDAAPRLAASNDLAG